MSLSNRTRLGVALYIVMCFVAATLIALIFGCQEPEILRGSGIPAPAPGGYLAACLKDPGLAMCQPEMTR